MRKQTRQTVLAMLLLLALPAYLSAQFTATGSVTDANNVPVSGASIKLKKSATGTSTDASGRFTLNLPGNSGTLEISSTGFKPQTLEVSSANATGLTIRLTEDIGNLEEVVVTGLATSVKRRNLANAVATISSKELSGTAPAQTFDAALNGKIPGAYINANSGAPGGGISIKLRGVTSVFGNTQPLFVIDGVFIDNSSVSSGLNVVTAAAAGGNTSNQDNASSRIADLRPEDIENVEILKGASAAAIYGSKAAAGVVLITTKKGKQGTRIGFSQDLGFIKARKLMGTRTLTPDRVTASGWNVNDYNAAVAAGKIYDYEKEMYGRTGFARNSILSMSGGSERTSFYFSASQKDEEGIISGTGYRSNNLRLNIDHRISDKIKAGFTTNYINTSSDRGLTNNDNAGVSFGAVLANTPSFAELHPDANGIYPDNPFGSSNPIATRDQMTNNEKVNRFIVGGNIDAVLQQSTNSTTRIVARGGVDFYNMRTNAQFPSTLQFQKVNKGTSIQGFTTNLNYNYIFSVVNTFSPTAGFSLTSSAGLTQESGSFDNLLNVATQVVTGQSNVNQAGALTATQFRTKFQDNGVFIQEEATLIDAITLTAGLRFDKSTNNGDPDKYTGYPKAGLSWNLTRMDFWKMDFFNNLKIRAAYGQAGNFPAYGSKFTSFAIANIGGQPGSLINIQRGLPDIKPERTSEFEAGIDFSILQSKLNFEFSVYNKQIKDFLLLRTVPASSGYSTKWVNAGDLRNRGIEIGMNAQPIATKNIRWNSSTNFWMNRSKVTRLTIPPVVLGAFGTSLGTFKIEKDQTATQLVASDGANGVVKQGDTEPDFQMNFFNELVIRKNISFRFLLHWKQGGDNLNLSELLTDAGSTSVDYDDDKNKNGTPDAVDRLNGLGAAPNPYIQDASYLRLREIALYYSFSKIPVSFIKGLRVGISANNFWTQTKYRGYDPEVSNFGTGFSTNVDVAPFPASKRAAFHLAIDL